MWKYVLLLRDVNKAVRRDGWGRREKLSPLWEERTTITLTSLCLIMTASHKKRPSIADG